MLSKPCGYDVTPECEIIPEGGTCRQNYDDCEKNPNHENFYSMEDFPMEHLPKELQTESCMELIKKRYDLTVRIKVSYTSPQRPDTFPNSITPYPYVKLRNSDRIPRYGTGSITHVLNAKPITNIRCPCHKCEVSKNPEMEHFLIIVRTATHVIYDSSEAKKTKFECFYNDEKSKTSKTLYGLYVQNSSTSHKRMYRSDVCEIVCVTHDSEIVKKLCDDIFKSSQAAAIEYGLNYTEPPAQVIVSHPHGCCKKITVGTIKHLTVKIEPEYKSDKPNTFHNGTECLLPLKLWESDATAYLKERFMSPDTSVSLKPGEKFFLPSKMTFTLPKKACYAFRYYNGSPGWYKFPPGTVFALADGTNIPLPDEAEFKNDSLYCPEQFYVVYDIPTCPGSSGSTVYCDLIGNSVLTYFVHSGEQVGRDTNVSGLYEKVMDKFPSSRTLDYLSEDEYSSDVNLLSEEDDKSYHRCCKCKEKISNQTLIPVNDFRMKHLPKSIRTQEVLDSIRNRCNQVVKINTTYISPDRPATFPDSDQPYPCNKLRGKRIQMHATGSIVRILSNQPREGNPCPCFPCQESHEPEMKYWIIVVQTAAHVVYDNHEAKCMTVECFYDTEDKKGVKKLYGFHIDETFKSLKDMQNRDEIQIFCVTHDSETFFEILKRLSFSTTAAVQHGISYLEPPAEVIISHQHGKSKKIVLGTMRYLNVPIRPGYDTSTEYTLEEGTECLLPLKPWTFNGMDDEGHGFSISSLGYFLKPGQKSHLPSKIFFVLPEKAEYAFRYYRPGWFVFYPETKFFLPDGTNISIPNEAEFRREHFFPKYCDVCYDIPTCKGSSGAPVYCDLLGNPFITRFLHRGTMKNVKSSAIRENIFLAK